MRNRGWLSMLVIVILALTLVPVAGAEPPDDPGPPDPGPLPPGLAVKVFIHHPRGHGQGAEVISAPVCSDPSAAGCNEYGIAATSGGLPIRWQDPTGGVAGIPHYVMLNYSSKKSPNLTKDAARAAIDASFATWEAASDAGLNFTNKGEVSRVVIPRLDGKNVVGWKGLRLGWIAVTYVWYYTSTGYIAEFDMVLNDSYPWTYTVPTGIEPSVPYDDPDNSGVAGTFDVRNIATHEAGHTLMLLDLYDPSNVNLTMYGYGAYAELRKDTLALGDDLGVDAIY